MLPLAFNFFCGYFPAFFLVIVVGRIYFVWPITMTRYYFEVFEAVSFWCPPSAEMSGLFGNWGLFQSNIIEDFLVGIFIFKFPKRCLGIHFWWTCGLPFSVLCLDYVECGHLFYCLLKNSWGGYRNYFVLWHWCVCERDQSNQNRRLPRLRH